MPVIETYSKRRRRAQQTEPDVYQFDSVPDSLRVQVRRIFEECLGNRWNSSREENKVWATLRDAVARELGKLTLTGDNEARSDCLKHIHTEANIDFWLDLVELGARLINGWTRKLPDYEKSVLGISGNADDAISELNQRFREAGVGYQFEDGEIIRVDSQYVHSEVVKPALQLLSNPRFAGPQQEFLAAHSHYRAGEYKDAITDALNAFESTLKVICSAKGWNVNKGARASDLLKVVRGNGLLPDYLDNSFDQLVATLQSGLPKVRNEEGAHGQGAAPRETPGYIAAYALHLAAAKIVLLVQAFQGAEGR